MLGTPRYIKVYLRSIICSVAVLAATNSEPYVAVSAVAWFRECQSVGVWLQGCISGKAVEKIGIKCGCGSH